MQAIPFQLRLTCRPTTLSGENPVLTHTPGTDTHTRNQLTKKSLATARDQVYMNTKSAKKKDSKSNDPSCDLPNRLLFDVSPSLLQMGAWATQSPLPQLTEGGIVHWHEGEE